MKWVFVQPWIVILKRVTGRFAYGSFCLLSVHLRLESICLCPIWQFTYVLMMSLTQINRRKICVNIPRSKKDSDIAHQVGESKIVIVWSLKRRRTYILDVGELTLDLGKTTHLVQDMSQMTCMQSDRNMLKRIWHWKYKKRIKKIKIIKLKDLILISVATCQFKQTKQILPNLAERCFVLECIKMKDVFQLLKLQYLLNFFMGLLNQHEHQVMCTGQTTLDFLIELVVKKNTTVEIRWFIESVASFYWDKLYHSCWLLLTH